jgi:hypothetical protein
MKLWVDDVRPAPEGYIWVKSVNEAKELLTSYLEFPSHLISKVLIDLDHDAGDFAKDGGDYIKLLDWLEQLKTQTRYIDFHIHSQNPVGVENMRRIIKRNGWKEV